MEWKNFQDYYGVSVALYSKSKKIPSSLLHLSSLPLKVQENKDFSSQERSNLHHFIVFYRAWLSWERTGNINTRTLGMANVIKLLLLRNLKNVINHHRKVFQRDIFVGVIEELISLPAVVGVEFSMAAGVDASTRVAHPYVVTGVGELVSWRMIITYKL